MALLDYYDSRNRVILNDKVVKYSTNFINGTWEYTEGTTTTTITKVWQYIRVCQKAYQYVGMDRTTAQACAAAMITKYTRGTWYSEWSATDKDFVVTSGGDICMADVQIVHTAGCMYSVLIAVDETDTRLRKTKTSAAAWFANENARDYDEA